MNKNHTLSTENLLAALPQAIREDKSVYALASAAAEVLASRSAEIDGIRIYSRVDELTEEMLDILAYDFKVDWWDYRYTLEQKRRTFKDSFLVHKRLGTKWAVKTALSAIYPNSTIQEWFEYDGEPYTFRLLVNVSGQQVNSDLYFRAIDLINYYKNLRSHLRGVEYIIEAKEAAVLHVGGQFASVVKLCIPEIPDEFRFDETLHLGGCISMITTLPIPERADEFKFSDTIRVGGRLSSVATMPIPEIADDLRFDSRVHIGGRVSAITKMPIPALSDGIAFESGLRIGGRVATVTSISLPAIPDEA